MTIYRHAEERRIRSLTHSPQQYGDPASVDFEARLMPLFADKHQKADTESRQNHPPLFLSDCAAF